MINVMLGLAMFPPRGLMLSAFSPSGFGSRWLSWANSTSGNEFRPVCALAAGKVESKAKRSGIWRIEFHAANLVRENPGSAGCQPVLFGSLPKRLLSDFAGKLPTNAG